MTHKFLSDGWYAGVQDILTGTGGMEPADKLKPVLMNAFVKGKDGSIRQANFKASAIGPNGDPPPRACKPS